MQHRDHGGLCYRGDQTFFQRRRGRNAQCMAVETALAEELACFQYSNDSFLAVSREDDDFYTAFLNVKNRIGNLSLGEDDMIFSILRNRFSTQPLLLTQVARRPAFLRVASSLQRC